MLDAIQLEMFEGEMKNPKLNEPLSFGNRFDIDAEIKKLEEEAMPDTVEVIATAIVKGVLKGQTPIEIAQQINDWLYEGEELP